MLYFVDLMSKEMLQHSFTPVRRSWDGSRTERLQTAALIKMRAFLLHETCEYKMHLTCLRSRQG